MDWGGFISLDESGFWKGDGERHWYLQLSPQEDSPETHFYTTPAYRGSLFIKKGCVVNAVWDENVRTTLQRWVEGGSIGDYDGDYFGGYIKGVDADGYITELECSVWN